VLACTNGRLQSGIRHMASLGAPSVPRQTLARMQMAPGISILLLQEQSMPCWSNGTMTRMEKTEIFLTTRHYEATSSFGGAAINVPRARCTAGRLVLSLGPYAKIQQDALVVLGRSFVSATLCNQSILILLLILTLKRMVSLLLK